MRIATFKDDRTSDECVAIDQGDGFFEVPQLSLSETISFMHQGAIPFLGSRIDIEAAHLTAPVPSTARILCIATNYHSFIETYGGAIPEYPMVFSKVHSTLIGPHDEIRLSPNSDSFDWEAELAVVIGKPLRRGSITEAKSAIFGFTIANDVSARDWQSRTGQWFQGKNFEKTCPVGPWITTKDAFSPSQKAITSTLDGVVKQVGDLTDMIFTPAELVSYISSFLTLYPGDIILTGTPPGVGSRCHPPAYLQPGQILTTSIESLGLLRNLVVSD